MQIYLEFAKFVLDSLDQAEQVMALGQNTQWLQLHEGLFLP